jgi:multiple sugar transport system permease protein
LLRSERDAGVAATARRRRKPSLMTHLALLLICAGFALPFIWMISTSLKTSTEALETPPRFVPKSIEWKNYQRVLASDRVDLILCARNTLVIAALSVGGMTLSSALVAYGFAKLAFRGRGVLFALMLATMMIPFPVTMVSLFAIFRFLDLHTPIQWLGTFKPLWVPAWFGSAFNIFLLRQFFMTIPDELSEAARIDGCSDLGIFFRVMVPLAKPALLVVALFTFMAVWNDFLGPLVYLQRPEQYTLALGLQTLQGTGGANTEWNLLMAGSVLIILPVVILFFLTQRTFIQGIATTGIK